MTNATETATATMTTEAAEAVTADIREAGKALVANRKKFSEAVTRAKDGNAHVGMGFKSWSEYVATVFEGMPGLGVKDREYLTAFMAGEGMSSRAVARVLGVSQSTATRMVKQAEERGEVDPERTVATTNGTEQKAKGTGRGRKSKTAAEKAADAAAKAADAAKADAEVSQDDSPESCGIEGLTVTTVSVDAAPDPVTTVSVETVPNPFAIATAKTAELRSLAIQILAEMSKRWEESGDESAESAMTDIADAALHLATN